MATDEVSTSTRLPADAYLPPAGILGSDIRKCANQYRVIFVSTTEAETRLHLQFYILPG